MNYKELSELIFPNITLTPEDIERRYPERSLPEGAAVTRFAPSPTGFLHIGGLFAAMIAELTADKSGGVFFLRIEDTDKKREIADGITGILAGLSAFGITPDEGMISADDERGEYGPYLQSKRREIYQVFAKSLVAQGRAYPCFCTEDELNEIRAVQEEKKLRTGCYGEWAPYRDLSPDKAAEYIKAGKPFAIRLRSNGNESNRIGFKDAIKGKIEMAQNDQDVVILKTDGIPTYHFAHAVDDHLMRTTHVIRGDEWISSVPIHLELFAAIGAKPPKYAHISPIMREDNGGKRKLSKRKDPEAAVTFYREQGYPSQGVTEYLMTLANSVFEDWRRANPAADIGDYDFKLSKMNRSGALFDLNKLNDVCKNVISRMTAQQVYSLTVDWSREYDPELFALLSADKEYAVNLFNIDRECKKPRKDIAKWSDVKDYIAYFYNDLWHEPRTLPDNISKADAAAILRAYLDTYTADDDKDEWFARIKGICPALGFSPDVKEYKSDPSGYKGHVGDVSGVIRIAVTARRSTPDLYSIMQLIGENEVKARLGSFLNECEED